MYNFALLLVTLLSLGNEVFGEDHSTTYEQLFELGMDAYRQEKWSKCAIFLQKAIDDYHFFKNAIIDCRLQCRSLSDEEFASPKLQVFHEMLEDSNCLRRCKKKKFGMRPDGPQPTALDKKFEKRAPYNFLQFCLFRENKLKEAVATAYTYYITNQDDEMIIGNLRYYRDQDELTEADFVDLERKPYQSAYVTALLAYNDGDWRTAAENFEKSLELYFTEEERCRAGCERPFTHTGYPDFISAVADHYVVVIVCQQNCLRKLSNFGMEELENFVSEHFNYLQYAYYNMEDYDKAAIAVANFLLLRPDDTVMNRNKDYYIENLGLSEEKFMPSQEVIDYINYWRDVEKSLDFVREKYILPNSEIKADDEELQGDEETERKKINEVQDHYMAKYAKVGIKLFAESEQLKGSLRFAADEFFREDQCLSLADLAKSKKPNKLGIRSVGLPEMLTMLKEDEDYEMSLRLLLRAGDIIQHYTSAYFNQSKLWVREVKVVCKAGGDGWEKEMPEDCIPQEDGSCLGESQTDAEYVSIAYLSDIDDGTGNFYFMDGQHKMQSSLQPRCGRLVGFATNDSYGVNFSWKKERCAMLMTFTSDPDLATAEIQAGKDLIKNLEEAMVNEIQNVNNTALLNEFYRQGLSIAQTGEDLFGKERFAADGLATEKECQELIRLAKHGKSGDGYRGIVSPHTDWETFKGLEILSVLKKGVMKGDGYDELDKANPLSSKYVSPYSKYENFAGLNITRALKLVTAGKVPAHSLQLLLDISEHGRLLVETYFNLSKPLYFDFTHLVCRTAVEVSGDDEEERGKDLSHPVHSDNCMIQDDGSCVPDESAYSQRHYSALMYLNGDFEGGEFFFAHKNKSEQVALKPKCGRIVGFNAGEYHGVKAVTKGQRCALAMWLTHDANYKEIARFHTQRELDRIMKRSEEHKSKNKEVEAESHHIHVNSDDDTIEVHEDSEADIKVTDNLENLDSEKDRNKDMSLSDTDKLDVDSADTREQHKESKLDTDDKDTDKTENSHSDETSTLHITISDSDTVLDIEESDISKPDLKAPVEDTGESHEELNSDIPDFDEIRDEL